MITKDSIEAAYCFFHQKYRVYAYSTDERQREDIEYAVEGYAANMSAELYERISDGDPRFLRDYTVFERDLKKALTALEQLL